MASRGLRLLAGRVAMALLGIVISSLPAEAQRRSMDLMTQAVRDRSIDASIAGGRIAIKGNRVISPSRKQDVGGNREVLTISLTGGESWIKYERESSDQRLVLESFGGLRLHLSRTPKGNADLAPLEFSQPVQGEITLIVGVQDERRVYQTQSLWYLLIAEQSVCLEHLVPLLKQVNSRWDLTSTCEEIERSLVEKAGIRPPPDRRHWVELVRQLGSERFTQREAADRELRALGPLVAGYLQTLDMTPLDTEQRFRIRRILLGFSSSDQPDTPEQIALWLAGDPQIWLALLGRDDETTRQVAFEQLKHLVDQPVAFDPKADASTRRHQLNQLRARLLGS